MAPASFIPLAEESRLIVPIGRWVLDEACRQAAAWNAEGLNLGISVNVSAVSSVARNSPKTSAALARSRIEPASLTLEITETTLVRDVPAACERLQEVKALGVRVAIDDFGTGYASLSHLQRMPVDILKIDRSFVAALGDGPQSRELLAAILGVGQSLSLSVVAEGIELASQLATLEEMGCEMAQGFLLGHPGPAEEIEALLERGAARAHAQPPPPADAPAFQARPILRRPDLWGVIFNSTEGGFDEQAGRPYLGTRAHRARARGLRQQQQHHKLDVGHGRKNHDKRRAARRSRRRYQLRSNPKAR